MMNATTTIRLKRTTIAKLRKIGSRDDTDDDVITRLIREHNGRR